MSRRHLLAIAAIWAICITCFASVTESQDATQSGSIGAQVADLKDQLEKGLKARRPEEFQFVATVLQKVQSGELPVSVVRSTLIYVRKERKKEKILFPYFQQALKVRAAELGVKL